MQTHFPEQRLVIKATVLFTRNPPLSPWRDYIEIGGEVFERRGLISFRKDDGISSP